MNQQFHSWVFFFFFLAVPRSLWDFSSPTRDWTWALGSEEHAFLTTGLPGNSPLLGIYLEKKQKTLIQKDTCTPMFIEAFFTVIKIRKQPKSPSRDEWIKKIWYTHTHTHTHTHNGLLLSHKKEWNFAICSNMDGLGGYYAKWNKSDRERQISYDIT